MVICLKRGADCLHMVQMMPLHPKTPSYLASFKSRLVLPFWYRLTQVVLEMRPLNESSSSSYPGRFSLQAAHPRLHRKYPLTNLFACAEHKISCYVNFLDLLCKGFCKLSVFVELLNSLWIVEVPA